MRSATSVSDLSTKLELHFRCPNNSKVNVPVDCLQNIRKNKQNCRRFNTEKKFCVASPGTQPEKHSKNAQKINKQANKHKWRAHTAKRQNTTFNEKRRHNLCRPHIAVTQYHLQHYHLCQEKRPSRGNLAVV